MFTEHSCSQKRVISQSKNKSIIPWRFIVPRCFLTLIQVLSRGCGMRSGPRRKPFNKSGHPGMCMMFQMRWKIQRCSGGWGSDSARDQLSTPLCLRPFRREEMIALSLSSGARVLPDSTLLGRSVAQASSLESALSSELNKADAWGWCHLR